MHFWINKSQGCGFNGRYVPPSISSGSRRNVLCGGIYPKPMVTPVHRFQSIESVASAGHRHPNRGPSYHTRFPVPSSTSSHQQPPHYNHEHNGNGNNGHRSGGGGGSQRHCRISTEYVSSGGHHHHHYHQNSLTRTNSINGPTAKLKCGVWTIIGLVPFLIAAAKYYINGAHIGIEALMFFAVLIFILVVIGVVSLFEAFTQKRDHRNDDSLQISSEQNETFEESAHHPVLSSSAHHQHPHQHQQVMTSGSAGLHELPPPPYHIAVMLPSHHSERLIQDSPPPTYEKAVT